MNSRVFDIHCQYKYVLPSCATLFNVFIDILCSFLGFIITSIKYHIRCLVIDDDATIYGADYCVQLVSVCLSVTHVIV